MCPKVIFRAELPESITKAEHLHYCSHVLKPTAQKGGRKPSCRYCVAAAPRKRRHWFCIAHLTSHWNKSIPRPKSWDFSQQTNGPGHGSHTEKLGVRLPVPFNALESVCAQRLSLSTHGAFCPWGLL